MFPMGFNEELGVFSPEGKLMQVDFAKFASNQGGAAVIHAMGDKLIVAYENRQLDPLVIPQPKIHAIDPECHFYLLYSGFKPDSLLITEQAIFECRNYKYTTSVSIRMEQLASKIADYQHHYTVDSDMRPFGLKSVLMGIEKGKSRIFVIDTDGTFAEYQRISVGSKNDICNAFLEGNDDENCAFNALKEVVQKDYKKIMGFLIDKNGCNEIEKERIKAIIE